MRASLSNRRRTRLGLLMLVTAVSAAGCADPIERPGTWKPTGVNDQNLRAMLVNPHDIDGGTGALTSRGDNGSRAVSRLLADRRRALLDASLSHVAPSAGGSGDSGPAPSAGGGGTSGSAQ